MSLQSLAESLIKLKSFQDRYVPTVDLSVASQFTKLVASGSIAEFKPDWKYLLQCASVLAHGLTPETEDAALRIAQACLNHCSEASLRDGACVILDTLTNKPTISLAERRDLVEPSLQYRLPMPLRLDWMSREIRQMVITSQEEELYLNRFQSEFWREQQASSSLSLSAPTSAGKSFLLYKVIEEFAAEHRAATIVYIVPTRSLILQVQSDLNLQLPRQLNVKVSSLPTDGSMNRDGVTVMVLTQERLHLLTETLGDARSIDLLIVDEAQKVGDGARGVLLENVIDRVHRQTAHVKTIFASPLVDNPEALLPSAEGESVGSSFVSSHVTVNQNLIWVSQLPRNTKAWKVDLCTAKELRNLGRIDLRYRPDTQSKRLTFVAATLGDEQGGNLIYVNGAADAEKAARQLADLFDNTRIIDEELESLASLVRKNIHPEYLLASVVECGIAFHYGNMPLIIRSEIERLFKANKIQYLVCTSTLVEGVNLPCKSIFVRGPKKGRGNPMNEADFWNLAGRAGRLGQEFQGNVVCVDPNEAGVWRIPPPRKRGRYSIGRASSSLLQQSDEFAEYLRTGVIDRNSASLPELDQLVSMLINQFDSENGLSKSTTCQVLDEESRNRIETQVRGMIATLNVPLEVINRHPGVNPLRMEALLAYFRNWEGSDEELMPSYPDSSDAVASYTAVFNRIGEHLSNDFSNPRRSTALAILVVNWMRGYTINRLIRSFIMYLRRNNKPIALPKIIRSRMDDVEQIARFLAPRFVSCYVDILRFHFNETGKIELASQLPEVALWLEFGASQTTQLSLMGLGLSRISALTIAEFIADDELNEDQVLMKIQGLNMNELDINAAVRREVETLLARSVVQ